MLELIASPGAVVDRPALARLAPAAPHGVRAVVALALTREAQPERLTWLAFLLRLFANDMRGIGLCGAAIDIGLLADILDARAEQQEPKPC